MIAHVYGRIDGKYIELESEGGNRWISTVPFNSAGEYIVEIIAEDDAGNISYFSKMLFVIDAKSLCAHVIDILPYFTTMVSDNGYKTEFFLTDFFAKLINEPCNFNERK